jgi:hypothetical protein
MRFPAIHKILIIYTYLGIDFGTSSVKVVVFAVEAVIKGIGLAEYPILTPRIEVCRAGSRAMVACYDNCRPAGSGRGGSSRDFGNWILRPNAWLGIA